jgi:hypothetical protein
MKRNLIPVLIIYVFFPVIASVAAGGPVQAGGQRSQDIATALDHLTVIEYDEPVTQAAVGSSAFQIERQDNKVFIKPLRTGASTNLFIWTASNQRFSYELSVGDVASMVAEIHIAVPKSAPLPDATAQMEQLANVLVTRTLLGIEPVDTARIKSAKDAVDVRFEEVFRSKTTLFIRYAVENHSGRPYRVVSPTLYEVKVEHPAISLDSLKGVQLDEHLMGRLGSLKEVPIPNAHAESANEDVAPGARQQGIISVPQTVEPGSPIIVRLVLEGNVKATMVL